MKRKSLILLIIFIILSNPVVYANNNEEIEDGKILYENIIQELEKEKNAIETSSNGETKKEKTPILNSRRYVIFDRNSKKVIYGKDENKQTAMASTTKIMTSLVVLEKCKNLDEEITISKKSANTGGSTLGVKAGDKIKIIDLLYGLMLRSGNDVAVALAEYVGGSIEGFAKMMNDKAKEIGLENTNFVTPHGLDDPNHYTTATELAILTDYALRNEKFAEIVKTSYKTIMINGNQREINTTNELLLSNVDGVYGVKTGFTNNAGRCLVTAVKRNDIDLVIVVLGADTRKDRAKDTLKLIDFAFEKYRMENISDLAQREFERWKEINQSRIYINKGRNSLQLELEELEVKKIVTDKEINTEINVLNYLDAPVEKGRKIGTMVIRNGDDIIEEIDILVSKTVEKRNIIDYFYIFAKLSKI